MAAWQDLGARSRRVTQLVSGEPAPTLQSEGVSLSYADSRLAGLKSILVFARAESGQTFTGVGTMLAYVWNDILQMWTRSAMADLDCSGLAGLASGALPTLQILSSTGRLILVPSGVGVSGGTTMTTDYIATTNQGAVV